MAASKHVYLIRHGIAEDRHPFGDGARALTREGRVALAAHARRIASRVRVEAIATSPLVRAVQTAELVAAAWGVQNVIVRGELDAERATGKAVAAVARELGAGWALVGHNPAFGEALAVLQGVRGAERFKKGAIAALEPSDELAWELAWMEAPGQ